VTLRHRLFCNEKILSVSLDQKGLFANDSVLLLTNRGRILKSGVASSRDFDEIKWKDISLHQNERYISAQITNNNITLLTDQNRLFLENLDKQTLKIVSLTNLLKPGEKFVSLEQNEMNSFLLTDHDRLFSLGGNSCGELGLGHNNKVNTFTDLKIFNVLGPGEKILSVRMNTWTTFFLTSQGRVFRCGATGYSEKSKDVCHSFQLVNLSSLELGTDEQICSIYTSILDSDQEVTLVTNQGRHFSCGKNVGQFGSNRDPFVHDFTLCSYPQAEPARLGCTLF
jgi:alpha-tubulin suppressor-like RCC1 family protein